MLGHAPFEICALKKGKQWRGLPSGSSDSPRRKEQCFLVGTNGDKNALATIFISNRNEIITP
jgi:hypothetical protein